MFLDLRESLTEIIKQQILEAFKFVQFLVLSRW